MNVLFLLLSLFAVMPNFSKAQRYPPCHICSDGGAATIMKPGSPISLPPDVAALVGFSDGSCEDLRRFGEEELEIPPDACPLLDREDLRLDCGCTNWQEPVPPPVDIVPVDPTPPDDDDCALEYVLFNADLNTAVGLLIEQLDNESGIYCIPDYQVNIEARPTAACSTTTMASAWMTLVGPTTTTNRQENEAPYMVFRNTNSNILGETLQPGSYTIASDVFSDSDLQGELVVFGDLGFEAQICGDGVDGGDGDGGDDTDGGCAIEFILFDADTNEPVGVGGGELLHDECVSHVNSFNIQARSTPECPVIESADMVLEGPVTGSRIENGSPYMIFSDNSHGDIYGQEFAEGSYTINAKLFSENNLKGDLVVERQFDFTVSGDCRRH